MSLRTKIRYGFLVLMLGVFITNLGTVSYKNAIDESTGIPSISSPKKIIVSAHNKSTGKTYVFKTTSSSAAQTQHATLTGVESETTLSATNDVTTVAPLNIGSDEYALTGDSDGKIRCWAVSDGVEYTNDIYTAGGIDFGGPIENIKTLLLGTYFAVQGVVSGVDTIKVYTSATGALKTSFVPGDLGSYTSWTFGDFAFDSTGVYIAVTMIKPDSFEISLIAVGVFNVTNDASSAKSVYTASVSPVLYAPITWNTYGNFVIAGHPNGVWSCDVTAEMLGTPNNMNIIGSNVRALATTRLGASNHERLGIGFNSLISGVSSASYLYSNGYYSSDGTNVENYTNQSSAVTKVGWYNDESTTYLATASTDNTVKTFIIDSTARSSLAHTGVTDFAISSDGLTIVTSGTDNNVKVWNEAEGSLTSTNSHSDDVNSVSLTFSEAFVISGSDDNTAKIWHTSPLPGDSTTLNTQAKSLIASVIDATSDFILINNGLANRVLQSTESSAIASIKLETNPRILGQTLSSGAINMYVDQDDPFADITKTADNSTFSKTIMIVN